jgi:hypothetical protein
MKFCKNLQQVVDISDPEWAPYWPNYKMLKVRDSDRFTMVVDLVDGWVEHVGISTYHLYAQTDLDIRFSRKIHRDSSRP